MERQQRARGTERQPRKLNSEIERRRARRRKDTEVEVRERKRGRETEGQRSRGMDRQRDGARNGETDIAKVHEE